MGKTIEIWQLKEEHVEFMFMGTSYWEKKGKEVRSSMYEKVYTFEEPRPMTCEDVYMVFNVQRPSDFTGHSLSVSDVVVFRNGADASAWFCDSIGFTDITSQFFQKSI